MQKRNSQFSLYRNCRKKIKMHRQSTVCNFTKIRGEMKWKVSAKKLYFHFSNCWLSKSKKLTYFFLRTRLKWRRENFHLHLSSLGRDFFTIHSFNLFLLQFCDPMRLERVRDMQISFFSLLNDTCSTHSLSYVP